MGRFAIEAAQSGALLAAGLLALVVWRHSRNWSDSWIWLLAGVGSTSLAVEDAFDIHGRLAARLWDAGVRQPEPVNHLDDLLLIALAACALPFVAVLLMRFREDRRALSLLGAGGAAFAAALLWDAFASTKGWRSWWFEESLELLAALLVAGAFGLRALRIGSGARSDAAPAALAAEREP